MLSGICPKCGSDAVYASSNVGWRKVLLNRIWGTAKIMVYCCVYCGYVEEYVQADDRGEIAKHWQRVVPEGKRKRDMDS
jgi:hypothetical protein